MAELQGSARWSLEAGQRLQIEREHLVAWVGHATWVASMIGTVDPSFPHCICRRAEVEPVGPITGSPAVYSHARVKLTYIAETTSSTASNNWPSLPSEAPTFPANVGVQIQVRGSGEFLLFPARDMRYGSNLSGNPSQPIPQEDSSAGRVIVPVLDWTITLTNLGSINRNKLTEKLGHCNAATFLGYPAGCVLFESWDADQQWTVDGGTPKVTWRLGYHFKVRAIKDGTVYRGWNWEYVGATGWELVYMNGKLRYELTSFADIFT